MNMDSSSKPALALIAGPTASGKSALALMLAERANGTVINADSAQVYRDLRILSARPDAADETRAPHHLYGYRDGAEACSAADWAADATAAIAEARDAGRLPILVGGTGLYLRTLLDGIAPVPPIDPAVRRAVRAASVEDNRAALARRDPAAAARLAPADTSRIARALEVVLSTGRPLADWQAEKEGGIGGEVRLAPLLLLPPRDWLHARCDARFDAMVQDGEAEVRALIARRLDSALPVMRAIGVPEMIAWQEGRIDEEAARAAGALATRRYAKRQYTWFRHQPPADWPRFDDPLDSDAARDAALALIAARL